MKQILRIGLKLEESNYKCILKELVVWNWVDSLNWCSKQLTMARVNQGPWGKVSH